MSGGNKSVPAIGDWNTLRQVAGTGYGDGIICLATIETVERSNRAEVIGPLNEVEAGRAARLLVEGAIYRLHMFVTRALGRRRVRMTDTSELR